MAVYDNTALAEGETKLARASRCLHRAKFKPLWTALFRQQMPVFQSLSRWINFYKTYEPPAYNNDITLSGICEAYRNFACSRMHLYYDIKTIRLFIAGMASTKLIILQGISGTGKTSLPYSFGKFLQKDTTIALFSRHA